MSIKPILFNADMVHAILDGRKTVTRRILAKKETLDKTWGLDREPYLQDGKWFCDEQTAVDDYEKHELIPLYRIGDILYIRETQSIHRVNNMGDKYIRVNYKADGVSQDFRVSEKEWKRLMKYDYTDERYISPYWTTYETARIWLKVTNVRVERLQDMPHDAAGKEGIHYCECPDGFTWKTDTDVNCCYTTPSGAFKALWNSTVKKEDLNRYGWESNPWVWVIEFERCEKPKEVSH